MSSPGRGVRMERAHLRDLPRTDAPSDFRLRLYEPGDEQAWLSIHREADAYNTFTDASFTEQFGADSAEIARRQLYLVDPDDRVVGTTTAWYVAADPGLGMIHWVAIRPACQGRGLARPLLARACALLGELGHTRAFLSTDTARVAAVCLYFDFGFMPNLDTRSAREAWADFLARTVDAPRAKAVRRYLLNRV